MERNFVTQGSVQLIECCRLRLRHGQTLESLCDSHKKIAEYPIENIKKAKLDEPPKEFITLCIALAEAGIAVGKKNNLVDSKIIKLIDSAKTCLEQDELSTAADKILDAIDKLRFAGVPIA